MKRYPVEIFLFVLIFDVLGASASEPIKQESVSQRPNVVLLLGDYMGYGDIGPYGVPDTKTPALDRLAREGVKLTNAYAAAPICTPSRIALLTGRYQHRAGMEKNARSTTPSYGLPSSEVTVARMLKDAGYSTALFGKWHLGYEPRFGANEHGFDEFFGLLDWTIDYYSHKTYEGEPGLYENTAPVEKDGYITDLLTDRALSFIDRHVTDPFFLFVSYNAALPPCQPPNQPTDVRTRQTWNSSTRQDYIKVVEALDTGIGRILETLDSTGLAENTLVIFTYDHGGGELSRKGPLFHGFATLWEGGIRVPLLLRWPRRLPAGVVSSQLTINMDLTASILAATDVAAPPGRSLDGINLLPILEGKNPPIERTFCWRIDLNLSSESMRHWLSGSTGFRKQKAVRKGRWKYMYDGTTPMLFDLDKDIGERNDLVYQFPDVVEDLRESLAKWETDLSPARDSK